MYAFSGRSLTILYTVKPPLQRVALRAIQLSRVDFGVVQGLRTQVQQLKLYGQGRTATQLRAKGVDPKYAEPTAPRVTNAITSNHQSGNAIDVCPFINGNFNWDNDGKLGLWPQIATAFKAAGNELNIKIYWGGDWKNPDRPHFSLVPG